MPKGLASEKSCRAKTAPFPALSSVWPKRLGEDIVSFLNESTLTASLNDIPFGADKLRIGWILVGSSFASNMLTRKFANGGVSNGPATNLFLTHVAIVSVIISPFRIADFAFLL